MIYIGKKKNHGPWFLLSEVDGVRHERVFHGLSDEQFYASLRSECGLPEAMPEREVYRRVTERFSWNGENFTSGSTPVAVQ